MGGSPDVAADNAASMYSSPITPPDSEAGCRAVRHSCLPTLSFMSINSRFNVEDELAIAIASIGGVRVTEILGRAPGHKNADFFFQGACVVAELKCLDEDKTHDDRIIKKASILYLQELNAGRATEVVFGEVPMTTSGYSADFTSKIAELYRIPIERQVRRADVQIAETKKALRCEDACGLLLVANNNHSALDPWHAWYLIDEMMTKPAYSSIDAAVLFAGNLGAALPGRDGRVDYWIEFHRGATRRCSAEFLSAARGAWFQRLGELFRESARTVAPSNLATLARLQSQ
jgi:hypothetical protein